MTSAGSEPPDPSNGYDNVADEFMSRRGRSNVGLATVREWAKGLPPGGEILDLGCGHGVPIAQSLISYGFRVSGVDASPTLVAAFRNRFPDAQVECAPVEESRFFEHTFDGVIAWGLFFLLAPETQVLLIRNVAAALKPGGRFLFTAPEFASEWVDVLTGRTSVSLGSDAYRRLVDEAGLILDGEADDEGDNHYYFASKPLRLRDVPTSPTGSSATSPNAAT